MTNPDTASFTLIQFGTGNFLRGFIGPILQQWKNQSDIKVHSIVVKPTSSCPATYQDWVGQNGRYHVLTRGQWNGRMVDELEVIDHVSTICHPYRDFDVFLAQAEVNATCIVSNTTEAGLRFVAADKFTDQPAASFPGKLTQLLFARWKYVQGDLKKGYDILPCELVEKNGEQLRSLVFKYCAHWQLPTNFKEWVANANRFYNTLVDRIVPGRPDMEEALRQQLQFPDQNLVQVEPYLLWAIESKDNLALRLPLPGLGLNVVFTNDIQPYKVLKVSILNGAHTAMAMWGLFHGISTVGEFMKQDEARQYLDNLLSKEILPVLPFPDAEKMKYKKDVYDRFENPFIYHYLEDVALNSVSKFHSRLLPTMSDYYRRFGALPQHIVQALSILLLNYCGEKYTLRDEAQVVEAFEEHWSVVPESGPNSDWLRDVLSDGRLWETDLTTQFPELVAACTTSLRKYAVLD
jgi:tagaturonate reductase